MKRLGGLPLVKPLVNEVVEKVDKVGTAVKGKIKKLVTETPLPNLPKLASIPRPENVESAVVGAVGTVGKALVTNRETYTVWLREQDGSWSTEVVPRVAVEAGTYRPYSLTLDGEGRALVSVHGYLSRAEKLDGLTKHLRGGYEACFLWSYDWYASSSEALIGRLARQLTEWRDRFGIKSFSYLTHSWGGILLRGACRHPDAPPEARTARSRTVMFAPPSRGSSFAREWRESPAAKVLMGPGVGADLRELSVRERVEGLVGASLPEGMPPPLIITGGLKVKLNPFVTGWLKGQPNDGIVTEDDARLDTPHELLVLPAATCTHGLILKNKVAMEAAKTFLERGTLADSPVITKGRFEKL